MACNALINFKYKLLLELTPRKASTIISRRQHKIMVKSNIFETLMANFLKP